MFSRRVLPDFVLLRSLPGHAGVATCALRTVGSAVAAHARAAEIRAIVVSGFQVAVAATEVRVAAVIVITTCRRHARAVHPRVWIPDSVVSAN